MSKVSGLAIALCVLAACKDETPFEPLSALPFAFATNSCGPTDGPTVVVYLATQSFELAQPVAPYVQVSIPIAASELKAGDVFKVRELFTEANAWFYGSGVETKTATSGEVGITAFSANVLSGYIDLEFADGPTFRGTFMAAWQPRQILCG